MENKKGSELVVGKVYYACKNYEKYPNDLCRFELFDERGTPYYSIVKGCETHLKSKEHYPFIGFSLWIWYPNVEYTGTL